MNKVAGLASDKIGGLLNGVSGNVGSLLGSASDPSGLASKIGIDAAKLSGLGGGLQSKVLGSISKFGNPPADVNLTQAANSGLILDYIPSNKLKNIPATEPFSTAPAPEVDKAYLNEVVAKGGPKALASLYGVTDVNKISADVLPKDLVSSALSNVTAGKFNPLSKIGSLNNFVDVSAFKDKVAGAENMLSSLSGVPAIKDQSIIGSVTAKFGSSSLGLSPLDKLVNRSGDPTSLPYTGSNPVIRASLGMPPLSS
jgi:hypothetical protein